MPDKPELFGTDGIRGVAGQYPLDQATVRKIGSALGGVLKQAAGPPRVVVGKDTRESSEWISLALASGLAAAGVQVVDAGVITTPGVAFLTRHHGFSAGVVVSASHNPYEDNGIKILSSGGTKLGAAEELEIERLLRASSTITWNIWQAWFQRDCRWHSTGWWWTAPTGPRAACCPCYWIVWG
jgi:phosphoglucosamine mutase